MHPKSSIALLIAAAAAMPACAADTASFAIDTEVKLLSDLRTRGVSDSMNRPAVKLSVQAAHESGLIGLIEINTVSKKVFLDSDGYDLLLGGGYRFGDPDGWHFGVGLAAEIFPGAKFEAPHAIDLEAGAPADFRRTKYDSAFAVLEVGYGALEGRILHVLSKTYRGANTGGVCGTMLALSADPTAALACYARGDHGSRGTWLLDLGYRHSLSPTTTLNLHAGYQKVKNFAEANFSDYSIGLTHKHWGFEWNAEWVTTRTKVRELFIAVDGDQLRATDGNRFIVSVSRKF